MEISNSSNSQNAQLKDLSDLHFLYGKLILYLIETKMKFK